MINHARGIFRIEGDMEKKKALLKKFGSVHEIKDASLEELVKVPGMTRNAAESIKERL